MNIFIIVWKKENNVIFLFQLKPVGEWINLHMIHEYKLSGISEYTFDSEVLEFGSTTIKKL